MVKFIIIVIAKNMDINKVINCLTVNEVIILINAAKLYYENNNDNNLNEKNNVLQIEYKLKTNILKLINN